jgi:hypothetical protein
MLSSFMDPLNERAVASGLYTRSNMRNMAGNAMGLMYIGYGIDFKGGVVDPVTGIIRTVDAWLYPYGMVYSLVEDTSHPERVTDAWRSEEYGFVMVMISEGNFPTGINKGMRYDPGDMILFTENNFISPDWSSDNSYDLHKREVVSIISSKPGYLVWDENMGVFNAFLSGIATGITRSGNMTGSVIHNSLSNMTMIEDIML